MSWAATVALGALAGIAADWIAARVTGQAPTRASIIAGLVAGVALAAITLFHPGHGWHGRLLPLWLWGWLVAADADLRAQELYDAHTGGLLALALIAGIADHTILVAVAGAAAMAAVWMVVRGGLRRWTWRASAALAGAGIVVAAIAGHRLAVAQAHLAHPTAALATSAMAHAWSAAAAWMVSGGCAVALAPLLAWIGAISRRAADGEAVVGGADVVLWAAVGARFGLRWVWQVAAVIVVALAVAALVQAAGRAVGWRMPWAADHLPVVPVMFVVLAIAL